MPLHSYRDTRKSARKYLHVTQKPSLLIKQICLLCTQMWYLNADIMSSLNSLFGGSVFADEYTTPAKHFHPDSHHCYLAQYKVNTYTRRQEIVWHYRTAFCKYEHVCYWRSESFVGGYLFHASNIMWFNVCSRTRGMCVWGYYVWMCFIGGRASVCASLCMCVSMLLL